MILRHQFCSATVTDILKEQTLPHCDCFCIICWFTNFIYGLTGFHYHFSELHSWLPSHSYHVSSLRMRKALFLAVFFNILCLLLLFKAFTSLSTLNTYFSLLHFIHSWKLKISVSLFSFFRSATSSSINFFIAQFCSWAAFQKISRGV